MDSRATRWKSGERVSRAACFVTGEQLKIMIIAPGCPGFFSGWQSLPIRRCEEQVIFNPIVNSTGDKAISLLIALLFIHFILKQ
jgi:hypothetical protein